MNQRVTIAPEWRSERPLAPNLFVDEFAETFEMLRHFAGAVLTENPRRIPCTLSLTPETATRRGRASHVAPR